MEVRILKMISPICLFIFCAINTVSSTRLDINDEYFYTLENECTKKTTCVPLTNATFFGTTLPYAMTTSILIPKYENSTPMIAKRLQELAVAQNLPKCWEALQPLLCALYKPKCLDGFYRTPGFNMCMKALIACEPIRDHSIWPEFINCDNKNLFPRSCKDPTFSIKFNKTSRCMEPLLASESQSAFGIGGCGVPCYDPSISAEQHSTTDKLVLIGASICFFYNIVAILTFVINLPLKAPAAYNVLFANVFFAIFSLGWLLQFTTITSREEIACHKDGTRRIQEPITSNLMSSVVFVMIYCSIMGILFQWLSFTRTFYQIMYQKPAKFSVIPFYISRFFLIIIGAIIFFGKINGNGITGIAFIGFSDNSDRYHLPLMYLIMIIMLLGCYYFNFATIRLAKLFKKHQNPILKGIYIRLHLLLFLMLPVAWYLFCFAPDKIIYGLDQEISFKNYIMCKIFNTIGEDNQCLIKELEFMGQNKLTEKRIGLILIFTIGFLASMLVWSKQTFKSLINLFKPKKLKTECELVLFIDFNVLDGELKSLELKEKLNDPEKQELENAEEKNEKSNE